MLLHQSTLLRLPSRYRAVRASLFCGGTNALRARYLVPGSNPILRVAACVSIALSTMLQTSTVATSLGMICKVKITCFFPPATSLPRPLAVYVLDAGEFLALRGEHALELLDHPALRVWRLLDYQRLSSSAGWLQDYPAPAVSVPLLCV